MEYIKPKIEFYRQRDFSEKLNVTFAFIRENWKPLLKYSFYLIMPICLVQTFAMNSFFSTYVGLVANSSTGSNLFSGSLNSVLANYGVLMLCFMIGGAIIYATIYAMMQTYAKRENRLIDVTLNDFKDNLSKNVWKYLRILFIILFVYIMAVVIMAFMASISAYTLVITIPLFIAFIILIIPMMMIIPISIFEENLSITGAAKKAWKLGMATIWGMLGLMIVLYIISSVIQTVTMMPWYITQLVGMFFSISSESMITQSVAYKFIVYILGLIQSFGMYVSMIIGIIGLAFQYFHAREKVEGVTIESNISHFGEL